MKELSLLVAFLLNVSVTNDFHYSQCSYKMHFPALYSCTKKYSVVDEVTNAIHKCVDEERHSSSV